MKSKEHIWRRTVISGLIGSIFRSFAVSTGYVCFMWCNVSKLKLGTEEVEIRSCLWYPVHWKKSLEHLLEQNMQLSKSIELFQRYHSRFPSHSYRWLNAKIRLDEGIVLSDPYAHKCCIVEDIQQETARIFGEIVGKWLCRQIVDKCGNDSRKPL